MRKNGEKYIVDVRIQSVILKKTSGTLEKDALVSISIERGKHVVNSAEKEGKSLSTGDSLFEFHETLSLEVTMYSDGRGVYKEKVGKIVVRQNKKGFMSNSYISLGTLGLRFHELIKDDDNSDSEVLLENCRYPGSKLSLAIGFRPDNKEELSLRKFSVAQTFQVS
jgi:hypothetical protein